MKGIKKYFFNPISIMSLIIFLIFGVINYETFFGFLYFVVGGYVLGVLANFAWNKIKENV